MCFFSSRRRHTRSKRDWSSDVCSSDLVRARAVCVVSSQIRLQDRFIPGHLRRLPRRDCLPEVEHHDPVTRIEDRKSTRLNSSHVSISYAVFCLKKKI